MTPSLLTLGFSYALVAALLLTLCISLPGRRLLKIGLIGLVSVFYAATWIEHQNMLGWPTSKALPEDFRVMWITIDEPDKASSKPGGIFFWLRTLDEAGIPQGTPRAYRVPFSEAAAEEAQAALDKMEDGKVINGSQSRNVLSEKDKESKPENNYEGDSNVSGDDGFTPTFSLREVPPPTLPAKS